MKTLEHFEQAGTRGYYRPVGEMTLEQAVDRIADALLQARALGLTELLVNSLGLSGYEPPSVFGRHAVAVRWAEAGAGVLRLAVVARPEFIDPDRIGVVMAHNRGLDANVFLTEAEAIRWLDARSGIHA